MDAGIETLLERGDVHVFDNPFPLPSAEDRDFLLGQGLHHAKEIVYDPGLEQVEGHRPGSKDDEERLRTVMAECHRVAGQILAAACPRYAAVAEPFRTNFHVVEEATRSLRVTARQDLLHVDALSHTRGRRILRLFVNINPVDPRVWASSETIDKVLARHGAEFGFWRLASNRWPLKLTQGVLRIFGGPRVELDPYDQTMLAFSRFLKHSDDFQDRAPRKIWNFAPGQAWMAFTDGLVHADLRGRGVLDHLFLVPSALCVQPDLSPLALMLRTGETTRIAA